MKPGKVRPLAICVFYHQGRILAARGYDEIKEQIFYRPLGGKIEFGERGAETVVRELQEEIQADVKNLRYLGTLENIFTYAGELGHEIVLVYDGILVDKKFYQRELIEGREDDDELLFTAHWLPLEAFEGKDAPPLYPDGLLELLHQHFPD